MCASYQGNKMRRYTLLLTTALVAVAPQVHAQDDGFTLDPILFGSAFRDDRELLDTPVATSVVEREELETKQAGDFEQLIGDLPGVSIDGGPRGISQEPNIRGFQDEQIVLRFDGGRLNFGQAHRGRFFVDPDLVKRVEVVRGGGSTLFGSGALGGVISIETVDAADLLLPGQTFGGRLTFGYGSNGEQYNASGSVYADYGDVDLLFALTGRQISENLEAGGGAVIPFSQFDATNGLFKFGYEPSSASRLEFSYSAYSDEGEVPSNSNDNPGGSNPVVGREADVQDFRLSWEYAPEGSDVFDLSALFYGTRLEIDENRLPPNAPRFDQTTYDTYGVEIVNRSRFDIGVPVRLVYGFEAYEDTQEGTRDGGPRGSFPSAEARTFGVFAEGTFELSSTLDLIAGIRFDDYKRDPNDPTLASADDDFVSPRLGLSFRPNEAWQIYGNIAQAFRAPSLSELYSDGLHFAGVPFVFPDNFFVPNPNLEPEESLQFEIGTRFNRNGVFRPDDQMSFAVNAYYAEVDNFIEQVVNVFAGTTTSSNVDADLWGFEAEARYDASNWFVGGGLSIARGDSANGDPLGSIPQDRLTLNAGFRPTSDWIVGARATIAAEQDRVPTGTTPSEGYETVDLYASYSPLNGPLSGGAIRLGVDNVFDQNYTIYPNALSQPGRAFKLSATFTF